MIRGGALVVGLCLTLANAATAKSPTPEFAVKSILQEHLARKFADRCAGIAFDHAGYDRHVLNRLAQYSDRGVHARNIFKNYLPIQPHRYRRHIRQFSTKHGLDEHSPLDDFCAAARREMRARTPIGLMLKDEKGAGQ